MYNYANKYNIKTILTGANYSTECIRNPIDWMYFQSDNKQLRHIHKKFGKVKLKTFPKHTFYGTNCICLILKNKTIKPLNYFEYNKKEAKELLIRNYGWKPYPQKHFESRFTSFYEGFWLYKRFGFDVRKVQLSSLVLTQQISRDEALAMLEKPPMKLKGLFNWKSNILLIN